MPSERPVLSLCKAAALIGVHRNTPSKWLEEGCPAETRADRSRGIEWGIHLPDVIAWRVDTSIAAAIAAYGDGATVTKDEGQRRIIAEVAADEALHRVVLVPDVADLVAQEYAAARSQLQTVGAKVAGRAAMMTNAVGIQDLVDDAIREALMTLIADDRANNLARLRADITAF